MIGVFASWLDYEHFGASDPHPLGEPEPGISIGEKCDRDDCEGILEADNGRVCCPACDWMGGKA